MLNKKYKLLEKIGSGSFGSIYMCNWKGYSGQNIDNHEIYAAKIVIFSVLRKRKERVMDNCSTKLNCINSFKGLVFIV